MPGESLCKDSFYTPSAILDKMVKLTEDDVLKLAQLARLRLTKEEIEKFKFEIQEILEYVELLQQVDVSGVEPTSQVTGLTNVLRPDKVIDYNLTKKELLKTTPTAADGHIKVKRVLQ
ncbi:Asp-tRNA(Asn)/Glu-tRNA(Gln) amidotransferase subunit GatC [soil metagenome]